MTGAPLPISQALGSVGSLQELRTRSSSPKSAFAGPRNKSRWGGSFGGSWRQSATGLGVGSLLVVDESGVDPRGELMAISSLIQSGNVPPEASILE